MRRIYKGLLVVGILALIISPVLGKTGGIKVDSDTVCESPNKEDNTIGNSGNCFPTIWLNLQNEDPGSYNCQICDSGVCVDCTNFSGSFSFSCGDGYFATIFRAPAGSGVRTVVISDENGNVGRDSFRLVEGGDCPD